MKLWQMLDTDYGEENELYDGNVWLGNETPNRQVQVNVGLLGPILLRVIMLEITRIGEIL